MAESPASEVRLAAQIRAHQSWAKTVDRSARTAPARAALERQFLKRAGGDPVRAEHLRTAYYKWLALQSAASRRRNRERRAAASRDDVAS